LPEELAGKKVKCQKCQEFFVVPQPGAETLAPGERIPSADEPRRASHCRHSPKRGPPSSRRALAPIVLTVKDDDADDPDQEPDDRPRRRPRSELRRRDRPAASGSSVLPILLIVGGLGAFLFLLCGGVGVFFIVMREQRRPMPP